MVKLTQNGPEIIERRVSAFSFETKVRKKTREFYLITSALQFEIYYYCFFIRSRNLDFYIREFLKLQQIIIF